MEIKVMDHRNSYQGERWWSGAYVDAVEKDASIGHACVNSRGFIHSVEVDYQFRRQGIGTAMLSELENVVRKAKGDKLQGVDDVEYLRLHVDQNNEPALLLYKKLGYTEEWNDGYCIIGMMKTL